MKIGKQQKVIAGGKTWTLSRMTGEVIFAFRDWIAEQIGDPFVNVDRFLDKLKDDASKLRYINEAEGVRKQLSGFSLNCDLAQQYLTSISGQVKLYQLMLEEAHPGVTEAQAFEVMEAAGAQLMEKKKLTVSKVAGVLEKAGLSAAKSTPAAESILAILSEQDDAGTSLSTLSAIITEASGEFPNGAAPSAAAGATA